MTTKKIFNNIARSFNHVTVEDVLDAVGANRRRHDLGLLAIFGALTAGAVIGASIGLLLAPKAGADLMSDLSGKMASIKDQLGTAVGSAVGRARGEGRPS